MSIALHRLMDVNGITRIENSRQRTRQQVTREAKDD